MRPVAAILSLVLLCHIAAAGAADVAADAARGVAPPVELERRAADGERCLVCGKVMRDGEVVVFRYKGRTATVEAGDMAERFLDEPEKYFHRLEARAALFSENAIVAAAATGSPVSVRWLLFGGYVVLCLVCAAICGYVALGKALRALPWFFAGLIGNVAALAVLLAVRPGDAAALPAGVPPGLHKIPLTFDPVHCSSCGAFNHPAAKRCTGCAAALEATAQPETERT